MEGFAATPLDSFAICVIGCDAAKVVTQILLIVKRGRDGKVLTSIIQIIKYEGPLFYVDFQRHNFTLRGLVLSKGTTITVGMI